MLGAIVLAFLLGLAAGVFLGRRTAPSAASNAGWGPPPVRPAPTGAVTRTPMATPNDRARKAGLTEEAFTPSDDILEKLRLAAEGAIDPAVLAEERARSAPAAEERPPPVVDPRLTDAEQRILDRLRREGQPGGDTSDSS